MLDISLLEDLGFEAGTGNWHVPTWVYDGCFWVELENDAPVRFYHYNDESHGEKVAITSRKQFLAAFIESRINGEVSTALYQV